MARKNVCQALQPRRAGSHRDVQRPLDAGDEILLTARLPTPRSQLASGVPQSDGDGVPRLRWMQRH
jgi:hypothetical protein